VSKKRAQALSGALCLFGFAILALIGNWWPGIMLVLGLSLSLRQYLLGKRYDALVSLLVFCGSFFFMQFDIPWKIFLPTIFTVGAIYILLREFVFSDKETEADCEEDINHEIEEKKRK